MDKKLKEAINEEYRSAEHKAVRYFEALQNQLTDQSYVSSLINDFQTWKINHIHSPSILTYFSRKKRKPTVKGYRPYIEWLNYAGKLDDYLNRSISYLYMRDLGKTLSSQHTQERIDEVVNNVKTHLLKKDAKNDNFSVSSLYKLAKKEKVEHTMIFVLEKLKRVTAHIPSGMSVEHAQRKILKILAGVLMHELEERRSIDLSEQVRKYRLEKAIKLGFYYGITYPLIDDLLDAKILSKDEEKQYATLIRTTLETGEVPALDSWYGENKELILFIHSELKEAFEYMKLQHDDRTWKLFLKQAHIFFHSQEVDREKKLTNSTYSNEEIYIPVILKSSASRQIVRSLMNAPEDEGYDKRTFYYGIYNQLADDLADMFDDKKDGAVTPYTYYLTYHTTRKDLINPFEMYWTVISYLIHDVYQADFKTKEVILDRAINGLKRLKEKLGEQKYSDLMGIFTKRMSTFNRILQQMVEKADDVDFFDKLLRDHMITTLKENRREQEEFSEMIQSIRSPIDKMLPITENALLEKDIVTEAANYSLAGTGKRIRPIITWFMGVKEFELDNAQIVPLLKSVEYMHTASLIFDDLPSQDNAAMRRGRPTLHEVYDTATAELTGLFLTQKAIEEQATLQAFEGSIILKLIGYTTKATADMCKGQLMDLESRGKQLTLQELNTLCFYKTGIGFEASLLMPAILAGVSNEVMDLLKKYAYHAGIAFQIKDDLLDVEGEQKTLGKKSGMDKDNDTSTFVTVLGLEGARKEMWEHYCMALDLVELLPKKTNFLKFLVDYMINRTR
ncbi:polyprenyl synthetase family protein [Niallia sp. MER TA 168]|uniref:polyprenyl synthetase family protein n=1 Tax=Niallia sp. MER TA 168 TaxID=2939568 RepID=UPI00203A677E|nr:polyprenyl synthetase family protein [Niallia sp. MER TA 168]MCM3364095.1 polyprenyl synthetase family protein [Niallia sp. MER TA 168]